MAMSLLLLALVAATQGARTQKEGVHLNPIRKVVTMLQTMQKKVTEEGEKEKDLYDKFMCYCKNSGGDLAASIAAGEAKAPQVSSSIEGSKGRKTQLEEELKQAQTDRAAAKAAKAEATSIREKEAAVYAGEKSTLDTNIAAINKAVAALEKGMAGGFLQSTAAVSVKKIVQDSQQMLDFDKRELLAFLSGGDNAGYAPQGGQVTGLLKQLGDEMSKTLADITGTETSAITDFEGLMAAKTKEIEASSAAIESKTQQIGELGVAIVQMQNDLTNTEKAVAEDKKFQADLAKDCDTKTAEWGVVVATRAEELKALAETIKILNDDDALELFKATLSASASFLQMQKTAGALRRRALLSVQKARQAAGASNRPQLDFIALALSGKKIGFEKVITMIDEMTANLKKEQQDDDDKIEYCHGQFDTSDDSKKVLERAVADEEASIARAEDGIKTLKEEIEALEAGIAALDKSVAAATEQRKAENKEFTEMMASNTAAKELLGVAKNRLQKFYNPKLYKAPAKVELSADDRIAAGITGTEPPTEAPGGIAGTGVKVLAQVGADGALTLAQVNAHQQSVVAPPPPPEAVGAYAKKSEENTGVIAMMDLLIKDLVKEMTEGETSEKDAQADYETMMSDAALKRAADLKSLNGKVGAKAGLEGELQAHKDSKLSNSKELMATLEYIGSLHTECDWLIKYYDVRKEARAGEVESLANAKAVLSGADFSML